MLFAQRASERASSKHHVETGNRGVSRSHHRRPTDLPLKTMECDLGQACVRRLWHCMIPAYLSGPTFLATRSPGSLRKQSPILPRQDIATTMLFTEMAGLWVLIIHLIAVIVREFLTCLNIPDRYNPDDIPELFGLAVWVTRMMILVANL